MFKTRVGSSFAKPSNFRLAYGWVVSPSTPPVPLANVPLSGVASARTARVISPEGVTINRLSAGTFRVEGLPRFTRLEWGATFGGTSSIASFTEISRDGNAGTITFQLRRYEGANVGAVSDPNTVTVTQVFIGITLDAGGPPEVIKS